MIRLAATAALLTGIAGPALSLSCLAPDVARSFKTAAGSDETYAIVLGAFAFDAATPPFDGTALDEASIPAQFEGELLAEDGFTRAISGPITLQVSCETGICGTIASGERVLAFVRESTAGPVVELGPCPQWVFPTPESRQIARVIDCATGGPCTAE
ncbi:hypothetical protein E2L08_10125 [Palleronia sediminis]|uniref:Lipoprotein n=1 Tax=Palleronia sediminis TaxID=2547833 RepID=A0A4R6A9K3_9RHOB|nr:hypothetical protein [Palleronia sediminis]TDL79374.1 hypothetical protein E2L08_10125 [Palleronia sediminis]